MNEQEAKKVARETIAKCMFPAFATIDKDGFPQSRAMMAAAVEEDFTVYYVAGRPSSKCSQIAANPKVSTLWTDVVEPMKDWRSVLIKGTAEIKDDKALRDRFWVDQLAFAFPQGADDPNFIIIVVKPTEMIVASQEDMRPVIIKL